MCGIAGRLSPNPLSPDRRARALAQMRFRGPDGQDSITINTPGGTLDLLHSRLSILDLNARSDQPFVKDGLSLIYNGEIYNFEAVRAELEALGHHFRTTGDTEVLLEAWRAWGSDALSRLEGMWAFAIHDAARGITTLSRDRFGEKPLYLWQSGQGLVFGSEVKVLSALTGQKPNVDTQQLRRYLVNGYKGLLHKPRTFFEGVWELPPGTYAEIRDAAAPIRPVPYWTLKFDPVEMSLDDALEGAQEKVFAAVKSRLRADVPVAVRLSGGIDSNVIAGVARHVLDQPITCVSIVEDDPRYDETANIRLALEGLDCPNRQVPIPRTGFLERLSDLIAYFDAPMLTISYYLHALVSEAIHDEGMRVALGGTAADEVFTGYYDHYLFWLGEMHGETSKADFDALVAGWQATYGRFVRNPFLQDPLRMVNTPDARDHIFLGREKFSDFLIEPFDEPHAEHNYSDALLRNRMMNEVRHETVPVMLHDDDLASMRWSVENRAPFLDSDLVRFLFTVPTRHLVQDGLPKFLLRAAGRGIAPDSILTNPRKQGINAPVTSFVDFSDSATRERLLEPGPLFDIVRRDRFETLLGSEVALNSESKFLFSLICAKLFLDDQAARIA